MSLTIVKYRKTPEGIVPITGPVVTNPKVQLLPQQTIKKLTTGANIAIRKIPSGAILKPVTTMKRVSSLNASSDSPLLKTPKIAMHISNSSLQSWPISNAFKKESIGEAISSLPPNTIIKATTKQPVVTASASASASASSTGIQAAPAVTSAVRQAVFLQREMKQRSMRSITLGSIDVAPILHLGISNHHLHLLKRFICKRANLPHLDCCIALRKLRLNESFLILGELFELTEEDVQSTFKKAIAKLASCLRPLICWPDSKHYTERLKHLPFAYRSNLLHVRSLIECVETDVKASLDFGCGSYKFILCLNTNGIISYVSDAFRGDCDDLQLFEATNFKDIIPKYLTLCADPGKAVRRTRTLPKNREEYPLSDEECDAPDEPNHLLSKHDELRLAAEMANSQSLRVTDGALTSTRATNLQLPTLRVNEPACRAQMRQTIDSLRQFKMLDHGAVEQSNLLGYLNEMLIVAAALCNLQQQ